MWVDCADAAVEIRLRINKSETNILDISLPFLLIIKALALGFWK